MDLKPRSQQDRSTGSAPRVTVGVPIYNGAATLREALDSILAQTIDDIEIVVSDNASTDATPDILRDYAARDNRLRWHRQPSTMNPTLNFKFVLDQARAPYFMWAAHDDRRSPDSIALMLAALEREPEAILAFGTLVEIGDFGERRLELPFDNVGLTSIQRLRREAHGQLHHLYGLWRTDVLQRLDWTHSEWWHDTPLMMAATMSGDYVRVEEAVFYYRGGSHPFFDWQARPGLPGAVDHARGLSKRMIDIAALVGSSYRAVSRVRGPWLGTVAGGLAVTKIMNQTVGFLVRRLAGTRS